MVNISLNALKTFEYKAESTEVTKVQQSVEMTVGIALWNMVALEEAVEYQLPHYLIDALREEVDISVDRIYTLLSLLYDPQSISNIRKNIESGTAEGIGFAIELLDLFVAEELKPKLFPIFDDISIDEKIYRLELFYPIERLDKSQLLVQLINRDYNYINNWTKASAMYTIITDESFNKELKDDYIAQIFNEDPLLYECAAWLIYNIDSQQIPILLPRVNTKKQAQIEKFIKNKKSNSEGLLFEKGLFLYSNKWMSKLEGKLIGQLCKLMKKISLPEAINLKDEQIEFPLAVLKSGRIDFDGLEINKGDILSDLVINDKSKILTKDAVEIYIIENEDFYDLIYLNQKFLDLVLKLIDTYHEQNVELQR